ncbi:hypothetical protein K2Y11_07090 [bacterium]|nr:hypothetical protein [bacterium]
MDQNRQTGLDTIQDDESPDRSHWLHLLLLTALVLQLCWMLNAYPHWKEPNSASRVYLSVAMAEYGTFQIDKCLSTYGDTLDKALYQNHFYSDKAPGTSFLFVPVTWVVAAISPASINMQTLFIALRILCVSLPTIGFWWLTLPWFRAWTGREDRAIAVVAAGALGTNFYIYSTQLFAHVPAAWFLFLAFLSVRRCWTHPDLKGQLAPGLLGGALAGVAFLNDYVVMVAVATLGIATFLPRFNWKQALAFGLGLAPSLVVWMGYNWVCFGHPLKTGFVYHASPIYGNLYDSGFLGMQQIDLLSAIGMLFSPARGMCFLSPILALAPIGWWRQIRGGTFRADAICSAAIVIGLLLFAMTTIDWRGGWGIGTRYLVATVPFLMVGIAGAVRELNASHPLSIVFGGLAIVGVVLAAMASVTVPLFPQDFHNPFFTLVWPLLRDGYIAPHLGSFAGPIVGLLPYLMGVLLTLLLVSTSGAARGMADKIVSVSLCIMLAGIVLAWQTTMPEPSRDWLARDVARAEVIGRLGYFDAAAREMSDLQNIGSQLPSPPAVPSSK